MLALVCGLLSSHAAAQTETQHSLPEYRIHRASSAIQIDGRLDDEAWESAPEIDNLTFTWYESGKKEPTVVKLLWDDEYLYIGHVCHDSWITARCKEHDGPVPQDDCLEVMLAPNVDRPGVYFNIEWNVLGTWVDNHRPNGPDQPRAPKWDAEGIRIAGTYDGTLNDDSDQDKKWVAEVAIPFSNFETLAKHTPPHVGEAWNLNLNRHGGDTNPQYSQWAPGDPNRISFHTPYQFGRVIFVE